VSLSHGGVVPHVAIRLSRLWLGEFESHAAKRLLQHYLPQADMTKLCLSMHSETMKIEISGLRIECIIEAVAPC
jgi:hypothetical protein